MTPGRAGQTGRSAAGLLARRGLQAHMTAGHEGSDAGMSEPSPSPSRVCKTEPIHLSFSVCSGQASQRVRMVMPPWGRPPARAAVRMQKWDHMLSWISLASRSVL
jgi:hypothetical protein